MKIAFFSVADPHWFQCGSGSSILVSADSNTDPVWPKIEKNYNWKKLYQKLSLVLLKGRPSFRRSLQPSKENIQLFKTLNFITFLNFCGSFFALLVPDPHSYCGSESSQQKSTRFHADPDPQHCFSDVWYNFLLYKWLTAGRRGGPLGTLSTRYILWHTPR